jgi:hypothetical protein
MGITFYLLRVSSNGLKDLDRDLRGLVDGPKMWAADSRSNFGTDAEVEFVARDSHMALKVMVH